MKGLHRTFEDEKAVVCMQIVKVGKMKVAMEAMVDMKLQAAMEVMEAVVDAKLDDVKAAMNGRMDSLDQKMDKVINLLRNKLVKTQIYILSSILILFQRLCRPTIQLFYCQKCVWQNNVSSGSLCLAITPVLSLLLLFI